MNKKSLNVLSRILAGLRIISLLLLFVVPFLYGEDLFHYIKNYMPVDEPEQNTFGLDDFFALLFTTYCFFFPLFAINKVDNWVYNSLKKIEDKKEAEHLARIKACNLGMKQPADTAKADWN